MMMMMMWQLAFQADLLRWKSKFLPPVDLRTHSTLHSWFFDGMLLNQISTANWSFFVKILGKAQILTQNGCLLWLVEISSASIACYGKDRSSTCHVDSRRNFCSRACLLLQLNWNWLAPFIWHILSGTKADRCFWICEAQKSNRSTMNLVQSTDLLL